MKYIWRTLAVIGILLVFGIAVLIGVIVYDLNNNDITALTNTTITVDDRDLRAYIAQPEGDGPHPGVLMIHEWWGLRPDIVEKADRLAEAGYVVLAVDAYRGVTTDLVPTALFQSISYPQEQIDTDMDAYLEYLAALPTVDAERLAVMGYCFGGSQSTRFATRQAAQIDVLMTYYGGGQISDVPGLTPLTENDVAVLGVFGEIDNLIPLTEVTTFEQSLETLGVTHEVTVYPGVGHAFVKDLDGDGPSGDAWRQGVAFLDTHLQPAS